MPKLDYVMRGVKKDQTKLPSDGRLPVTPPILQKLKAVWEADSQTLQADTSMLWAACCLAFFGFLRVGELTSPNETDYDPRVHLNSSDISFDHPTYASPSMMSVQIKQSKTDPFRQGVSLTLGRTYKDLCPVASMVAYLVKRGSKEGPLFQFHDGRHLTRQRLVDHVRSALQIAGIDPSKYNGHSFRIGAATTAASKGIEDCMIKTLGRWESTAYLRYVRIPREQLAGFTRTLVA